LIGLRALTFLNLVPHLLARGLFFFQRHGVAGSNMVVINTNMAVAHALMAAVAAPVAADFAAGKG